MRSFVRENGLGSTTRHARVFEAWTEALEPELRSHAQPVRFRAGELTVEVDSSAHLHEMKNFTGKRYLKRANDHLGQKTIRRLVFKLQG